ncbi:uncharacterized protein LOC111519484 [Drosophila willistoni]|uniref:uncharacterized protein LOC111519484 n=1 Tax=Drosophila willistoni TaxID=7260 RepID=UPI000C26C891|nr:uncharacterized protein LOC111519484 [Drosophila willistoni]
MSSLAYGRYYVLISSPNGKLKLFRSFYNPISQDILDAASEIGIHGKYLLNAENNAVIGDTYALRYVLDKKQMLIVTDSLDDIVKTAPEHITLKRATKGESTTDEDLFEKTVDIQIELSDKLTELRSQFSSVLGSFTNFLQDFAKTQTGQEDEII